MKESARQNFRLPFSIVINIELLLKTTFRLHKARVCPTGFVATFAALFVLVYRLREFPLSPVTEDSEENF